jgi:hypothetical protein
LILDAISHPIGRFDPHYKTALFVLPDATLPELDGAMAGLLEADKTLAGMEIASCLIQRYATAAILPRVQKLIEPHTGSWACAIEVPILAYYLRVAPNYGLAQFQKVLAARGGNYSRCWASLWGDVVRFRWIPQLEPLAVASLDDDEPEVVAAAATALQDHGSPQVQEKLLALLRQRSGDSVATTEPQAIDAHAAKREAAIVGALVCARRWLLSPEQLTQVEKLCITAAAKQICQRASAEIRDKINVYVRREDSGDVRASVSALQFSSLQDAQDKLLQYPPGVVFTLQASGNEETMREDPARSDILRWMREHGLRVE